MYLCKTGKHSTWRSDPYVLAMFFWSWSLWHLIISQQGVGMLWDGTLAWSGSFPCCAPHTCLGTPKAARGACGVPEEQWEGQTSTSRHGGATPHHIPSALLCLSKGSLTAAQKWDGVKRILLILSMCGGLGYSELFKSGSFDLSPDPEWLLLPCTWIRQASQAAGHGVPAVQ